MNDGLQVGTGASVGHGLITVAEIDTPRPEARFTFKDKTIRLVPPHFFAVRPVRRLQRLVVLRADAGAEGIDIGSHWLPGFDGLGEM